MKQFKSYEKTTIKNAAKSAYPLRTRIEKLNADIDKLQAEKDELAAQIDRIESSVINITGGYTSLQLLDRIVPETTKEDGTVVKGAAHYEWKYPETIIPEETFDSYDEDSDCPCETCEPTTEPSLNY